QSCGWHEPRDDAGLARRHVPDQLRQDEAEAGDDGAGRGPGSLAGCGRADQERAAVPAQRRAERDLGSAGGELLQGDRREGGVMQTLQVLNEAFETQAPQDVLAYAIGTYFPDIVLASSFGAEDGVLIDMVHRLNPKTPSWSNGTPSSGWSSSTRSPGGRPRTSGRTSSCTRSPTTRSTTRTIPASAAPTAPARCSPARIPGPGAGPGSPRPSAGCTSNNAMDSHLRQLEDQSVYILREAYKHFDHLAMLWSMGKDSTVLLWLARKAFFGHVPFPLIHIDTSYKIPAMIEYRDRMAREWRLNLVIGMNKEALAQGMNHTLGRVTCCTALKTNGLKNLIAEKGYTGIIL